MYTSISTAQLDMTASSKTIVTSTQVCISPAMFTLNPAAGTGAAIIQGITIGEWTIIGAGAVVVDDIPANVTAVGIPAKVIKTREERWYER